jgi:predicted O-methyltransferase YrrM
MYEDFGRKGFTQGCELGVCTGANALKMFEAIDGLHLILVDPYKHYPRHWRQAEMDGFRRDAVRLLSEYDTTWMMVESKVAALAVPDASLDFIYIDGDHRFNCVMTDILLWTPKIRSGGVVSGHDYRDGKVRAAVKAYVAYNRLELWITDKAAETKKGATRSWMFIKP